MKNLLRITSLFFVLSLFVVACGEATQNADTATENTTETEQENTSNDMEANKEMTKDEIVKGYQIGDVAEDFSLKNVDGEMVSLLQMKDVKGYIITFTCNTCPFSVKYEDRLIDLHKKYAPMGYPVIAINPNDPEVKPGDDYEAMKVRSAEKDFPFDYVFDEGQNVFPKFGATRTPHIFILDKDLTVKYIGAIDDNHEDASAVKVRYVEDAIAAMEEGANPDPATTKAIGCTIKTKKKMM